MRALLVCLVGFLSAWDATAHSAEPWADPNLPVNEGLELWLDAARQADARKAASLPEVAKEGPIEVWLDASGRHRDVRSPNTQSSPKRATIGQAEVIRFDGENDCLRAVAQNASLNEFTVFIVGAPVSNRGAFLGLLALNAPQQRDYQSGITIDLGPIPTTAFSQTNIEGRGFGGAQNLLNKTFPFGTVHTLEVRSSGATSSIQLAVDGENQSQRSRTADPVSMEEITIGARFYTNEPGEQIVRGFSECDLAEVLIYNRELTADELKSTRDYLEKKHEALKAAAKPRSGMPLVAVENPPVVQVLVPGFETRQLPISLPNVNNIRCRPDGKLVTLGYDGNIHILSDTDGDGLEDQADVFWQNEGQLRAPIGMALTPAGYQRGQGVFVTCKGKVSLILDTNGDDKADEEVIVASGWKELVHNVDALGCAYDKRDGSVWFGIGTTDYTNAYQVGKDGKPAYSTKSERGAILRAAPDFKSWEIICSGIRFPVGMDFDSQGELFVSDQEGATWLPNGNPFDELLHIERDRHYGFPPRHPKHLPDVIDEPSVYDYGPQHQSTCGLIFNLPVHSGDRHFGPESWRGDAFVAGYSRGKIYRTSLVRTSAGYVASNHLFACLQQLTVDQCIDRHGNLLIATHSGGPDWGSGPGGKGFLYKVHYRGHDLAQPVAVWPSSAGEVQVAFDRPLIPEDLKGATAKSSIQFGEAVRAGDRFENLRPGYAVVGGQLVAPRFEQSARAVQPLAGNRTLLIASEANAAARVAHAVTLPSGIVGSTSFPSEKPIEQHPQIDLDYDETGVAAHWQSMDKATTWSGWLPHPSLLVSKAFTNGSDPHEHLWPLLSKPGQLTINGLIDLKDMLRPAVQPGAKIDYTWPDEKVTVTIQGTGAIWLTTPQGAAPHDSTGTATQLVIETKANSLIPFELTMSTGVANPQLEITWHTGEDSRERAFPLRRFYVPWSEQPQTDRGVAERRPKELAGGSWAIGRKIFFSEQAGCFKCHAVGGKGGDSAPNLSNLVHRDYASVLRDITEPSFAINPDFATSIIATKSGRVLTGTTRSVGEQIHVTDQKGKVEIIERDDIESVAAGKISNMPTGLPQQLGESKMVDLLTFLLTRPPHMPEDNPMPTPPARTRAEVEAVLAGASPAEKPTRDLRIMLVTGPKDHGPGEHDYPAWGEVWMQLLQTCDRVELSWAQEWPNQFGFNGADVVVFYEHGDWNEAKARDIDAFLQRGGGLVYIHYAVDGGKQSKSMADRIGLSWIGGSSTFRHGPLDLEFNRGSKHPIARNFERLNLVDESYWQLTGDLPADDVLASGMENDKPQPLFWAKESAKGRVFVSIPGHYSWTFDDPLYRTLLLRGISWAAKEPVDRLNEAIYPGAHITD